MADNVEVFRIVLDYQTAYEELERVKEKLKAAQSETRNLTIKQQELNEQFKQGVISEQEYQSASEALRQKLIANRSEVIALTEARKKAMQIEKSMALAEMAEANSLIQLRETLKSLTKQFDALGEAKQKSAKGVQLQKEIDGLNKKILELEMSTGRFGRNVGNYASGFSPLNFQVQQLTRELPSLTMSLQQFSLAISNNLPMFADELQRAAAANANLRKEGHATIPVWRQVLSSLGSWQTMLVVGITLLTAYGKEIGQWVKELFKGSQSLSALGQAQKLVNASMIQGKSDAASNIVQLQLLYQAAQDVTVPMERRRKAAEKMQEMYPSYLGNLNTEAILAGKAKKEYEDLCTAILQAARARAAENDIVKIQQELNKVIESADYKRWEQAKKSVNDYWNLYRQARIDGDIQAQKDYQKWMQEENKIAADLEGAIKKNIKDLTGQSVAIEVFVGSRERAMKQLANTAVLQHTTIDASTDQKYTEEAAREAEKATSAAKKAADYKKQLADDTIKYMREGREKDLAKQEQEYRNDLEKYKSNSTKIQEIEEWNHNQTLEINKKWDEKELDELDKQLKAQIDLMEDGTDKKITLLKLERAKLVRQAIMNGASVIEATEQANKWYKAKEKEIWDVTPEGKRDLKLAQIENTYEFEKACINQLDISDGERYKKLAELENKRRKDQADTAWAYIQQQYEAGKITQEVYEKNRKLYAGFYAEIANEAADIANIDTISTGGTSEKGLAKAAKRKSRQEKSNSFFGKLFGIDPKSKEGKAQIKQEKKELLNLAVDTARDIGQAVIDIQTEISQRRLKLEQDRIDAERDSELKSLELKYNKGLMSEKAYNKAVEAVNAEADRKKEEAERAAFEREKRLKIMGIAIDTAAGITKVWSETGLTGWKLAMAIAQTAFLTANGIAQTAVIASQQFAQGGIIPIGDGKNGVSMGMLQGPSHAQGGIPLMVNGQPVNAEVEGGEILAVINKRSAAQYLPLFSAINATNGVKFENGGVIGSGWSLPTPAPLPPSNGQMLATMRDDLRTYYRQTERMIKATTERIDNIKVHVVEKDITKTQKKVASIRAKATIIGGK